MVQWIIVAVLVVASAVYACWTLLPVRLRLRLLERVGGPSPSSRWLAALRRRALAELAGGCGSCAAAEQDTHITTPRPGRRP